MIVHGDAGPANFLYAEGRVTALYREGSPLRPPNPDETPIPPLDGLTHPDRRRAKPLAADKFQLPSRNDIDRNLLVGAGLFGVGWGLAGYCPGPALASVLTGGSDALFFAVAMVVGMWAAKRFPLPGERIRRS